MDGPRERDATGPGRDARAKAFYRTKVAGNDECMTRQHPTRILAVLVLVGAGVLAGCGDDEPSTEEATAEVCEASGNLDKTLTDVSNLDPTDTSQLADAREEISNDVDELSDAGKALAESEWDSFEQAWDNLRDTVDNLDEDTTFAEAREQLSSASEELTNAWDEFISRVEC
jgi:ABC-type transporter Mla subunit MlaD